MPRKWEEIVRPFEPLKENHRYLVQVTGIAKDSKGAMRVALVHVGPDDQAGRTHTVLLPLPIRPQGITADFLRAAAIRVDINTKITPEDVPGKRMYVTFSMAEGHDDARIVTFEPVAAEPKGPTTGGE